MQTGPEELRMTRQMKVSTEPQEEGRPGQHQGQLSVAPGIQGHQRSATLSFAHSFHKYLLSAIP